MDELRLTLYREAIEIERQRSIVAANLRAVRFRLTEIHRELSGSVLIHLDRHPPKSRRGELAAMILKHLKAAGDAGIRVRDLAEKIGAKPKNLFIWFATTGKKKRQIEKVGEGHYRLAQEGS